MNLSRKSNNAKKEKGVKMMTVFVSTLFAFGI
jgi:hypothetical protein